MTVYIVLDENDLYQAACADRHMAERMARQLGGRVIASPLLGWED